ncbi:MAG TPA: PQQ-dependent sugar dehydrogenase [Candidatus Saccharimonadales bacterium]|nr:PQQ-dependent sugar dehydrogenase [Candidatus Saccharimonadales bacterium]
MIRRAYRFVPATLWLWFSLLNQIEQASAVDAGQMQRGKLLYLQNCVICHQSAGQGTLGTFPPLAGSDVLTNDFKKAILAVVQGLSGKLTVNGTAYDGIMPPVNLDDMKVADVLTYVRNSFGNSGAGVTPDEVKSVRAGSRFPTYAALLAANSYPALPKAPNGFAVREVVRLSEHGHRLASDNGKGLFVLGPKGQVWGVEISSGKLTPVLKPEQYMDSALGDPSTLGMTFDKQHRFYVVADQRKESSPFVTNIVTIFRSAGLQKGKIEKPVPWFRTSYPWGIGPFNHGVSHIAQGPDGFIYVSSGSRTDGNEAGTDPRYYKGSEVDITGCIWRLDPRTEKPELEIYARGLRNPYGFCWTDKGEMFATDNGPDADAPEELNCIEKGKHYGFPFKFSNWKDKPYQYTPDPPPSMEFTLPVANLGPAASGSSQTPCYTFGPHTSPAGIAFLGDDFPEPVRGSLLTGRFGNLIKQPADGGFDLLRLKPVKNAQGNYETEVHTVLAPVARPLDVLVMGKGKVYILEYSRQTEHRADVAMLPGRILELSVMKP